MRCKTPFNPDYPVHVSARTNNKDWFEVPLSVVWSIMSDYLYFLHSAYGMKLHGFVLMSNHFHMVARFPENNLSAAMMYFMRETSRAIARESGRINHVYGRRYFSSQVLSDVGYANVLKYVYRNPVVAGLVDRAELYPFSTLAGILGVSHLEMPVSEDLILCGGDYPRQLEWLNTPMQKEHQDLIRRGLRRATFGLSRCPASKRVHELNFVRA